MKIGNMVHVDIMPFPTGEGLILGELNYSTQGDILLVGSEGSLGMPINKTYLTLTEGVNLSMALRLRDRYLAMYPRTLYPLNGDDCVG